MRRRISPFWLHLSLVTSWTFNQRLKCDLYSRNFGFINVIFTNIVLRTSQPQYRQNFADPKSGGPALKEPTISDPPPACKPVRSAATTVHWKSFILKQVEYIADCASGHSATTWHLYTDSKLYRVHTESEFQAKPNKGWGNPDGVQRHLLEPPPQYYH